MSTPKHISGEKLLNIPQAGFSDDKLLLGVENRNHVLVDVGCKIA